MDQATGLPVGVSALCADFRTDFLDQFGKSFFRGFPQISAISHMIKTSDAADYEQITLYWTAFFLTSRRNEACQKGQNKASKKMRLMELGAIHTRTPQKRGKEE